MKASELIELLQQVPGDSEVEVTISPDRSRDGLLMTIDYEAGIFHKSGSEDYYVSINEKDAKQP